VTEDVDRISARLAGLLLLQAVTMLPALARARAVAVASVTPLRGESVPELTRALRLADELDETLNLAPTLDLVRQLDTYRPPGRVRNRGGGHDLSRAIATSRHILPSVDGPLGRPALSDPHAQDTASAGDSARGAALARDLVQDLDRKLHAARGSIGPSGPAYVLAFDRALGEGIDLAHALDQLLRDAGTHEDTLPRAIARHRVLTRGDLPDHGLDLLLGNLLSRALRGAVDNLGQIQHRRTFPAEVSEFVIAAADVLPMRYVVSPDTLADVLGRALALFRAKPADWPASGWIPDEVANRMENIAMPVFTWQRTLTPADATAIRLAALCLAVAAESNDDPPLGALFREIAAGVTLLERRTDGRAPLTETIVLAIV
jgi:hypothetical protein